MEGGTGRGRVEDTGDAGGLVDSGVAWRAGVEVDDEVEVAERWCIMFRCACCTNGEADGTRACCVL